MEAIKRVLDEVLGKFVCEPEDIYCGQCTRLPKYLMIKCGVDWPGATGDGCSLVDVLVNDMGGYYMNEEESEAKGYRVCSCDVSGSTHGHTWLEIKINGEWVIYEQNVKREGTMEADFGCGPVYSVSLTTNRGNWRKNVRYAGHVSIDAVIEANTPKPEPAPEPTPEPEPVPDNAVWYTYKDGDTFGQVLKDLGLDEGELWGENGTVNYYTDQLWNRQPDIFDENGNVKVGVPFYLIPR